MRVKGQDTQRQCILKFFKALDKGLSSGWIWGMGLPLTLLLLPHHQPELLKFCHPQAMNWVLTLEDTDHQGHSRRAQVLPRKAPNPRHHGYGFDCSN